MIESSTKRAACTFQRGQVARLSVLSCEKEPSFDKERFVYELLKVYYNGTGHGLHIADRRIAVESQLTTNLSVL